MRLGFRTRLMLGTTLLVVAFVAAAVLVLAVLLDHHVADQVAHAIDDSRRNVAMQMDLQAQAWRRDAENAARSPLLLATAAIPDVDEATLADRLAEIEAPIVAILDGRGRVLASRGCWQAGDALAAFPGVAAALRGEVQDHVWPHSRGLALVAVAPLVQGGELLGAIVLGQDVDSRLAERIGAVTGSHVVLTHDGQALATAWRNAVARAIDLGPLDVLRHRTLPSLGQPLELVIDGSPRPGLALPLHRDAGIVYLSHDLDAIEHLRRSAHAWLLGIGLLLALTGIALSARTAARLSRPLLALTTASDRMGRGDLGARVDKVPMDAELQRLALSFDSMAETVQALVADVTDKAARAEAANRAKDGFLTSISHEMRTPLTGIQSTAELLQQFGDDASPAERAEFLLTIVTEAERLGRRITDALEFANLASGKTKWTVGRVELQRVCEEACRRLQSLLTLKFVTFLIGCDADAATFLGDREHITQAIQRLLHNAWTWSPADGTVDIAVRAVVTGIVVEVADRGPGIAPADRQRIFDSFTQGGDVLTDKPAGIGIGLKIAAEIAAAHGGYLDYADRPGGGACFRLLLRREDRPIDRMAAESALAAT
jgi:signal transduction histidine kinase